MSANSAIEWTDATWNPIRARNRATGKIGWHCEHASRGCQFCYSEGFNLRLGTGLDFKPGNRDAIEIFLDEKMLLAPMHWKKPRMIFICSMTDVFASFVQDEWLDRMFAVMALCPQHTFQVLTKRPERMRGYLSFSRAHPVALAALHQILVCASQNPKSDVGAGVIIQGDIPHLKIWPLPNVWLGVSAEDQIRADERIPLLLQTPAAVRFGSLEPLLSPIDLYNGDPDPRLGGHKGTATYIGDWWEAGAPKNAPSNHGLDWVIVGGESGPNARPMHPDWARSLRDQCDAAGVPFFFKQWGEYLTDDGYPGETHRVGKKAAGRLLDGKEHNIMPLLPYAGNKAYRRGEL